MRAPNASAQSVLQQALMFGAELLQATMRRNTRHASYLFSRAWRVYRPAHLPLYALAAIVGMAVVLLVVTAWLRVMMPVGVLGKGASFH